MSLKIPNDISLHVDAHKKWLQLLNLAEDTIQYDLELQKQAANGLRLKERWLPPQVLGKSYAQYCNLVNKFYDAYLNSVHLQRAPYMLELIAVFVKRLYELRHELVHLIVNDYIYVDSALSQLRMTPLDIEIVVPYHFPLESRSEDIEQVLQKMWADAVRRKKIKERPPKAPPPSGRTSVSIYEPIEEMSDEEDYLESLLPSVHTYVPEEFLLALLIQRHERYRQWYITDFRKKVQERNMYYKNKRKLPPEASKNKASMIIQKVYREFMIIKRERVKDTKRDILLGIAQDAFRRGLDFKEENNKVYERRRNTRLKIKQSYLKEFEKENTRVIMLKKDGHIDDITDEIRTWFKEWYYGHGFFPEYPYEVEGGTLLVVRGDFPTVEEKNEEDAKLAALNKGKTKEMIKAEKKSEKAEAKARAEQLKLAKKKEAVVLFKLKCNPESDPGYKPYESHVIDKLLTAIHSYRASWSIFDNLPTDKYGEVIYGYMKPLITEDVMSALHKDCRKIVDEMMRLDLKLLIKKQQEMYKRLDLKFPKIKPRKPPKIQPLPKQFVVDQKLLNNVAPIFDLGIVTKPTTKISDIYGDSKYGVYELNIKDPDVRYPLPGYGDIKSRLMLSCVFACGIQQGAPRHRAVMMLGPPRNGKSFLIDAVAGELNAVKIDITPEVFSAILPKPARALTQVFLTARAFQPAVIYMKNVERVFAKKVPPEERYLRATSMKVPLTKLVKNIRNDDKIIFIATCSNPFKATKPLVDLFDEMIVVPRTDYGTLQQFYSEKILSVRGVPRDFTVQPIAQLAQGYGFSVIIEALNEVMTPERIVRLALEPLTHGEILEALLNTGIEPTTLEEYQTYVEFYIRNSPLRNVREEYDIINFSRADAYSKIAEHEQKQKKADRAASRTTNDD